MMDITLEGTNISMAGHIEKRGKESYRLVVSNGCDSEGNRIRHYRTIKAKSEKAARKVLALFVAEIEKGEYIKPSKQTFKEFALFWIEKYARSHLKISTIAGYEDILEKRIFPAIGHIPIEKLNAMHLQMYYSNLQEDGIRNDGKEGGLSARTIRNHHNCISAILREAKKWKVIPSNVAEDADPPKIEEQEMDYYNEEEVKKILNVLKDENIKYYVLITLAITTGLRKSELLGLEWDAINFETNELMVIRTSLYQPGYGVYEDSPKSKSSKRALSISSVETKLLKNFQRMQREQKMKVGDLWEDHKRIFTQWNGKPMHPCTVYNSYVKILNKHNIPKKSFHSLRHSNITLLLAKNVDPMTVIHRAGHRDGQMIFTRYGHSLKSQDRKASNLIEDTFFN